MVVGWCLGGWMGVALAQTPLNCGAALLGGQHKTCVVWKHRARFQRGKLGTHNRIGQHLREKHAGAMGANDDGMRAFLTPRQLSCMLSSIQNKMDGIVAELPTMVMLGLVKEG